MTTASARAVKRNLLTPYRKVTGKEDHHCGERGGQNRQADFAAAVFRRVLRRGALFQVPVDVFERDDRIIDDARERQRQPAQDHGVDRASEKIQNHERSQRRERNRKKHRERGAQAAPEKSESSGW